MSDPTQTTEPPADQQTPTTDQPLHEIKDVSIFDDKVFTDPDTVDPQLGRAIATVSDAQYLDQRRLERAAVALSRTGIAVPPHCRNDPGVCYAILMDCAHWKIRNAKFIADHSYVTEQNKYNRLTKNYDKVASLSYDAQVFHAVIEASGMVEPVPDYEYDGEGENRTCTITYFLRGSRRPISYTTPPLSKCMPETFEKDGKRWVKGSQLWLDDPDMQQGYFAVRNLARKYLPLALAGIYDREELEYDPPPPGPEHARDVTESVIERLKSRGITGDDEAGFGQSPHAPKRSKPKPAEEKKPPPRKAAEKAADKPKAKPAATPQAEL